MADSKIVLITGANAGIGFETVKALLRSDTTYTILLGGRSIEKAEQAAKDTMAEIKSQSYVEAVQIDVESDDSISNAFHKVSAKYSRIDCLLNNAGAMFDGEMAFGKITARQAWNKAWDVNVAGAYVVTETFLPLLLKSQDPRLLFNTSGLSSLANASDESNPRYTVPPAGLPKPGGATAYRSSKAGLNMMMIEWSRMLKNDGVKVWAIAPGFLATGLGAVREELKRRGAGDPALGGAALCGVIEGKRDADAGKVVREYDTPVQPW